MLIPALALVLTGCDAMTEQDESENDYVAVCTDKDGNRVEDNQCNGASEQHDRDDHDGGGGFLWFYMATSGGHTAPPVGQRVTSSTGSYRTPAPVSGRTPVVARGGSVPAAGGAITRGGFGASGAKSGGGGS